MVPNPLLRKLGFADNDRVIIIHADDLGMCQASLLAFSGLVEFGLVSSAAVMVPCPWFLAAAAFCRKHPGVDVGVHTTLTSEWEAYRWGPVSTREPASGLLDAEGFFYRATAEAQLHASPEAAQTELVAQVERALAAGIDVTHIDAHMDVVVHPKYMPGYVQLAMEKRLPPMMLRLDQAGWQAMGLDAVSAAYAAEGARKLEEQGVPLLDNITGMPLDQPADQVARAKKMFDALPAGLTHFVIHPSADTPELRAITPDWESRVANYRAFMSPELRAYLCKSGIQVIGYRPLRELMRAGH